MWQAVWVMALFAGEKGVWSVAGELGGAWLSEESSIVRAVSDFGSGCCLGRCFQEPESLFQL